MTRREVTTSLFHRDEEPEMVCAVARAVGRACGLEPLAATRFGLAVAELVGHPHADTTVDVATITEDAQTKIQATVRGGSGQCANIPPGLIECCTEHDSSDGVREATVAMTLPAVKATPQSPVDHLAILPLDMDDLPDARQMLSKALVFIDRQAKQLIAADAEVRELTSELGQANQGLLALYATSAESRQLMERARLEAEEAGDAKATFLARMSHEIRSPLNAVIGFAEMLLETDLTMEQHEYGDTIRAAGSHLRGVVEGILDLSKIEAGRLRLEEVSFDLVECVEEAIGIVAPHAAPDVALAAMFAPETPVRVRGDPVRLRQVLVNLLANAVKFTSHGEVCLEVAARTLGADCEVSLAVRDTGVGIAPDAVVHLFEPFVQANPSMSSEFGGTGLGLPIARQLCELMGGTVTLESTVGLGSTFTATVRLRCDGPTTVDNSEDRPLAGVTVLVMHEQPLHREAISRQLRTWGADVEACETLHAMRARVSQSPSSTLAIIDDNTDHRLGVLGLGIPVVMVVAMASLSGSGDSDGVIVATPVRRSRLRAAALAALRREDPAQPVSAPHSRTSASSAPEGRHLRVLVAEDNEMNSRAITLMLKRLGCDSDVVPDGRQAIDAVAGHDYDLVLMDVHMPHVDGLEATRRIRQQLGGALRIVAVTASATSDTRTACLDAGMDEFLSKPVIMAELASAVDGARRARDHARAKV